MGSIKYTESGFQERLVAELTKYKWSAPDNLKNITVEDLIANWRKILNRNNQKELEGVPLTDNEFNQVLSRVKSINNSYEAAKLLSMENSKGKIDGIIRDFNEKVSRREVTLTIFSKAEVSGGDSIYQIAREVTSVRKGSRKGSNRFDIILLINGLPLINIELKKPSRNLMDAFYQFRRYYLDGEYTNNFLAFSQMMVIMDETKTLYFSTPKSSDAFNESFLFNWADVENNPVHKMEDICRLFLSVPTAHQLVGDYLVIDEAVEEKNRRHMILRPYQVHAIQAITLAIAGYDREDRVPHGGFIWHTTGSGKTITSFKAGLYLATRTKNEKVVFLVDRKDLDSKTIDSFQAYAVYDSVTVDKTDYTYELRKHLMKEQKGIIVSTIQKLSGLVKDLIEKEDYSLSEKRIVFIFDEAHRSTMGQMMGDINRYFKKKSFFFGFTGTPLFDENKAKGKINDKSELINTTEKLFGPMLHSYTIDQAIRDRNVLGFNVDFINTGEFNSYEELKDEIVEKLVNEESSKSRREIERTLATYSEADIELEAKNLNILIYDDEHHIPKVVESILENWDQQSKGKKFNAILTVARKERVVKYFQEFKRKMEESGYKINIAMTFSLGNENEEDSIPQETYLGMFKNYYEITDCNFATNDEINMSDYFEDLARRLPKGGSGLNKSFIDLVIVADQLLTGFDAKLLNTLYVDRSLELQGLIQAYSRTNRIYGPGKDFGSIINYQYPKLSERNLQTALKLYGSGGKNSEVIVEEYKVAVELLKSYFIAMKNTLYDPTDWAKINYDEEEKDKFLEAYKLTSRQLSRVSQYYEYIWDTDKFGMDPYTWELYTGAYRNLKPDETVPEEYFRAAEGKTRLVSTQIIDAAYIIKLIGEKTVVINGINTIDPETHRLLIEKIQEYSNLGNDIEANLLKSFLDEVVMKGKLQSIYEISNQYKNWRKEQEILDLEKFAYTQGIQDNLIKESYDLYSVSNKDYIPDFIKLVQSSIGSGKSNSVSLLKDVKEYFYNSKNKYK